MQHYQIQKPKIQPHKAHMMSPIDSQKKYKSLTRKKILQQQPYIAGTSEEGLLQAQLIKECAKTQKLIQISQQMFQKRKRRHHSQETASRSSAKKHKKCKAVSTHSTKKIPTKKSHKKRQSSSSSESSSSSSRTSKTNLPSPHQQPEEKTKTYYSYKQES